MVDLSLSVDEQDTVTLRHKSQTIAKYHWLFVFVRGGAALTVPLKTLKYLRIFNDRTILTVYKN